MKNGSFLIFALFTLFVLISATCASPAGADTKTESSASITQPLQGGKYDPNEVFDGNKITKTAEEWQKILDANQFSVLREHGTERPRSGEYEQNKQKGVYYCAACALPLFHSKTKFESGTGWPSYFKPINDKNVGETVDDTHGMRRVEVHCNRCDGHLGHVFDDGPAPTGLRYCINSASLYFQGEK
jgi:peptide-methionine (R)-S-oxide reductase